MGRKILGLRNVGVEGNKESRGAGSRAVGVFWLTKT